MNPALAFARLKCLALGLAVAVVTVWLSACAGTAQSTSSSNGGSSQATTLLYVAAPQVAGTGNSGMSAINAFRIGADGSLTPLGTAFQSASAVRFGPIDGNGHHVFGYQQASPSSLLTFAVQPDTGALQQTSVTPLPGNKTVPTCPASGQCAAMAFNPARALLAVELNDPGTFNTNTIALYSVDNAGNLSLKSTTSLEVDGMAFSPSGRFLYVSTVDLSAQLAEMVQFAIAPDGSLTQVGSPLAINAPAGEGLVITPNGRTLYSENFGGPDFLVFSADPTSGSLTAGPIVRLVVNLQPPASFGLDEADDLFINPRGTLLMTATSGENIGDNGVAFMAIDPNTGIPMPLPNTFVPLPGPGFPSYVWDDNGNFLYANAASSSEIQAFSVTDAGAVTQLPSQAVGFVQAVVYYKP